MLPNPPATAPYLFKVAAKIEKVGDSLYGKRDENGLLQGRCYQFRFYKMEGLTFASEIIDYTNGIVVNGWVAAYRRSGLCSIMHLYKNSDCIKYLTFLDNKKFSDTSCNKGIRHGLYKEYDDHGRFSIIAHYRNNKKHGRIKFYRKGLLAESHRYINGIRHGLSYVYDEDERVVRTVSYFHGKLKGWCYEYRLGKITKRWMAQSCPDFKIKDLAVTYELLEKLNTSFKFYEILNMFPDKIPYDSLLEKFDKKNQKYLKLQ